MAEMTAAEAIAWLTEDRAFGQECYSHKQIAQLIQLQQQKIEQLKCCGNCVHWVENTYMCRIVEVEMPLRFDKCDKWQGVSNND